MKSQFAAVAAAAVLASIAVHAQVGPTISSLNPSSAPAGSPAFTMSVNGANFRAGAFVSWNGVGIPTSIISSAQLAANVPAVMLVTPGPVTVYVVNPGGVQSNRVTFQVGGTALAISTEALPAGVAGTAYAATLTAAGGTAPYTWSATTALPGGLILSPAGVISGTPAVAGAFSLGVQVTDAASQTASRTLMLTITAPSLSITTAQLAAGRVGQSYSATLAATGGTAPYRWTAGQGFPAGLRLDEATGAITGTPTAAGTFTFTVQARDASQATATRSLSMRIEPSPVAITTVSPLFTGTVGVAYAQTFSAAGGTPPYRWTLSGNAGGLTLDASSGTLQGTPANPGTFSFVVQVTDAAAGSASQAFSVTVDARSLTIPTASSLPSGTAGVSYTHTFAVTGGTAPYIWSVAGGSVPGLTLDPSGVLSGIPSMAGTFTVALQARDAAGLTATRTFSVVIAAAALRIAVSSPLEDGMLAVPYSQFVVATGGVEPYTWTSNGLPEGLTIDPSTGLISGTPAAAGAYSFTVRVTDSVRATSVDLFRINVRLPQTPSARISGLPQTARPAQQFPVAVSLDSPFPAGITGQATISFAPSTGAGDGTIQFSAGGRIVEFTIPAGTTEAVAATPLAIQTGTVAGTITVSLRLQAGGVDITPSPAPTVNLQVDRAAPVIQSARMVRSGNSLAVEIIGYSTAREVTQMSVTFAAASGQTLQNSTVTVPVEELFGRWFQDPSSSQYGSQFFYSQPFTIQGEANAVTPQSVTLVNRLGSTTATITLP